MFLSVISSVAHSIHNLQIMWKYDDTTQCLLSLFRANTIAVLASLNLINLGMHFHCCAPLNRDVYGSCNLFLTNSCTFGIG